MVQGETGRLTPRRLAVLRAYSQKVSEHGTPTLIQAYLNAAWKPQARGSRLAGLVRTIHRLCAGGWMAVRDPRLVVNTAHLTHDGRALLCSSAAVGRKSAPWGT